MVFRQLGRRAGTVILVSLASGLLMMLGFVFFIIPAFIALAWTAAAVPVAAIEGLSTGAAITRSRELARGRIGHILGTMILVWLILGALFFGFMIVFAIVVASIGLPAAFVTLLAAADTRAGLPAGRCRGNDAVLRPARPQRGRGRRRDDRRAADDARPSRRDRSAYALEVDVALCRVRVDQPDPDPLADVEPLLAAHDAPFGRR